MDSERVVSKSIRHLRENKGLSPKQFAEKTGFAFQDIIAFEDGVKSPTLKEVDKIFHCFELRAFEYLMNIYRTEILIRPGEANPIIDHLLEKKVNKLSWVRLTICVIHADKVLAQKELNRLRELVDQLRLTDEEKAIARKDLRDPKPFRELIKEIEIPEEISLRKFLVKKTMEAAMFDDNIDPLEEQAVQDLMSYLKLEDTAY